MIKNNMEEYNFKKIEKKWQDKWEKGNDFKAIDGSKKPKKYILVEFPYPSGAGLHVGHARSYIALDVLARKKRKEGFNVLFPMGWDSFGLPTENYAIKTGVHPEKVTKENTENFKNQQKRLGLSFDWNREVDTSDSDYYKWTQWIFVQLFKEGLAYKNKMPINWCMSCKIGLANEEVVSDKCERCGGEVVKKDKEQWMLRITKYADRLLEGLEGVDYPERVKTGQREWIGRSEGTEIKFKIQDTESVGSVFTTRPDTIFGCTYIVLSLEHELVEKLKDKIKNYPKVEKYIQKSKKKTISKAMPAGRREKTGIELEGVKATNPVNNKKVPVFIADYVLGQYGTGAIMSVPAHDERDLEFSKEYDLPVIEVVNKKGVLVSSGKFTGLKSEEAKHEISEWLESKGVGGKTVQYKLRDWVFSRQRYWGEPIPMVNCEKCGWVPEDEKNLPIKLPKIKDFKPGPEGESPLIKAKTWLKVACPECGGSARRETDVMPNWAGSNWYFLRYCDPKNDKKLASDKKLENWMPVDWYNGGMEHTTLHLLYSRFIFKFLWDIKAVPKSIGSEPYKKRTSHGMILGEGGVKMSKSKGNVINPDEIIEKHGADVLRVYEMFMGPFDQMIPWDTKGLKGASRFLERVWNLKNKVGDKVGDGHQLEKQVHKAIKKVGEDIDELKFNTAISTLMTLLNQMEKKKEISMNYYSVLLTLLSPFAPHMTDELWDEMCGKGLCWKNEWPRYNPKLVSDEKVNIVIQVNGKVRAKIEGARDLSEKEIEKRAMKEENVVKHMSGKKAKKVIFIKDKLINFVL